MSTSGLPAFVRELEGTLSVHAQYVLHGNIHDQYLVPSPEAPDQRYPVDLRELLWIALQSAGYEAMVYYDPVHGISEYPPRDRASAEAATRLLGRRVLGSQPTLMELRTHLSRLVGTPAPPTAAPPPPVPGQAPAPGVPQQAAPPEPPRPEGVKAAFVIGYAARIPRSMAQLDEAERDFFLFCQQIALTAEPRGHSPAHPAGVFNPVIWLVEGERDLPAWLTAGIERIRTIAVPMPGLDERRAAARIYGAGIPMAPETSGEELAQLIDGFARRTDGMTVLGIRETSRLAHDRGLRLDEIGDAVRIYKLGIDDNPWRRASIRGQIQLGEAEIPRKVLGQDQAVLKTLDILKRAALGLSGAQASSSAHRPRGVLFFAGPTGVGKTELAKSVAEVLFGDADAYLRFDMSEFAAEHSDHRLIGAPPGYVGFEAGGELTGAVRRQPFRVVLFDEIEKAHHRVLDKFLQILEDGRLTDGQGLTTHFTECVLIFTSNLGIIDEDQQTHERTQKIRPGELSYRELEREVRETVKHHFISVLGRPELLNRLGDNIVVFDFISPEVADEVFALQLGNIRQRLRAEHRMQVDLSADAAEVLRTLCTADLDNGGRGIGNQLESRFINPLARHLFDRDIAPGVHLDVRSIRTDTTTGRVDLDITERRAGDEPPAATAIVPAQPEAGPEVLVGEVVR
ncbi:AAA family ATPase [Catellatospora bangladeshensis]|uniref:Chaperone n=1 Tax=Catellatospora bangladeshensis TaxID=310355 RepID=A0A8J3JQF1_9ACTN|nr:AAA family ATPase [Catellatospora bangladeshensis]GIF83160.1 chaperone [Catellatospora bangladeshensis]